MSETFKRSEDFERLIRIEQKLNQHIDSESSFHNEMKQVMVDIRKCVYGNGQVGIVGRVDRLEGRWKLLGVVAVLFLGSFIKFAFDVYAR